MKRGAVSRSAQERARDEVAKWITRLGDRFAAEPPEVRVEIRHEALERQLQTGAIAWAGPDIQLRRGRRVHFAGDTEICRQRVVSRHRLRRYGALPDNAREWLRQTNEVRQSLGLPTIEEALAAHEDAVAEVAR